MKWNKKNILVQVRNILRMKKTMKMIITRQKFYAILSDSFMIFEGISILEVNKLYLNF